MARDNAPRLVVESTDQWRDWLAEHHADEPPGVWAITWKQGSGGPVVTYEELVLGALCFGWIDSSGKALDDRQSMLWITRRKKGSGWARTNKARVVELEAAGLMAPAGRAMIEAARADGSWTLLDDVENLVVPDDLAAALGQHPGARENFDAFPPSARRALLEWLVHAKRAATRTSRLEEIAREAAAGRRANQWTPRS
ncbi:YdeI/OmpD-associated family protein [Cellulomonas edaphi]|uniref:YdeI/OmpD-associated family protein n=1 Tax=Cellulomonas edaphi TaxID=3053468 RepID=A0ABT7S5Q6_9CELL|nr:YdeI/OmpD-associated family protein [Cellulomons edaphi]MDM7830314.1 YdeI/OmpD-associated family protein [Cellulomons edaphi]